MYPLVPLFLLLILVLLVILRFIYTNFWVPFKIRRHFLKQGISGPTYRPIYGNTSESQQDLNETLNKTMPFNHDILHRVDPSYLKWSAKYGKNFLSWHGSTPRLALAEPEMIKDVMLNKSGGVQKPHFPPLAKPLFGDGLIALHGDKWTFHRKVANQGFTLERVKAWIPDVVDCTQKVLKNWDKEKGDRKEIEVDVLKECHVLSAEILSRTAFGSNFEEGKLIFQLQDQQALLSLKGIRNADIPGLRYLPTHDNRMRWGIQKKIRNTIRMIIQKESKTKQNSNSLINLFASGGLPVEEIVDECQTFYFAGKETVAILTTWAILLLALHQDWQNKAREEVFRVCKNDDDLPSADNLNDFKILTMIVNETLRLYPPVPFLIRHATENIKLGKLDIPAGTQFYLAMTAVHHDKEIWGEDANEFNPQRFAEPRKHLASFFPLGLGPRICVGQNFALMETKIILAMILKQFYFVVSPSYVHAPVTFQTVHPQDGARVLFRRVSS